MKVLIIVPIFNEEHNIARVLDKISSNCDYDVLIVDDGSTDNSFEICQNRKNVSVIRLPSNLGIGGARQTGFKYAFYKGYDVVVQLDGDDQHDPHYIKSMIQKIQEGNNICIGSRFIDFEGFQSSFLRRMGIFFLNNLIKLITGQYVTDPTSGFRVCDKEAIALFAQDYPQDYPEPESIVIAAKNNIKICEVPVTMSERGNGRSSIGSRFIDYLGFQSSFMRRVGISLIYSLIRLITGQSITDPTSGFRVCDKSAIKLFSREYPLDFPEPESIVSASKNKLKICEVAVNMNVRKNGKSSIGKIDSIYFIIKVTIAMLIASISNP